MSVARAVVVILILSVAAAAVVALVARTPASVRRAEAPPDATDPSLGASFTPDQEARHGTYRRISYAAFFAGLLLETGVLLVLARGPIVALAGRAQSWPGGWLTTAAAVALTVAAATSVAALPLRYVRGYVVEHDWGRSTQDLAAWAGDMARSAGVGLVLALVAAVAFFGVLLIAPRVWWLIGWAVFTALTALLALLWPVVVAPLFNRFTPLDDPGLEARVRALASDAGVRIDEVLVADASKRSTLENAYVAGLGATKRMVLYDTLVAAGNEDETAYVVAHELGHEAESHVPKLVALSSLGLAAGFLFLRWLAGRTELWAWAGAQGIADPRSLPLLLVIVSLLSLVTAPAANAVSRSFERRADSIALELTRDPGTAIRVHRRLAFANLSDLDPPPWAVWLFYTHPPVRERITAARPPSDR